RAIDPLSLHDALPILLEELRSIRPDTAVVMISGVDDPELGTAALEHGAYAYHVKPVGATQLYLLVVNNLRRRSLEMEHRASVARDRKSTRLNPVTFRS